MTSDAAPASGPLHAERRGTGPTLVLVHGFTQTGRCWGTLDADLERDHQLVLVDAPGHGGSAAVDAGLGDGARFIGEAAGRGTYLGYSMGGRFCLRVAVDHPDLVERLVLLGASPGLHSEEERAARRAADDRLADRIAELGLPAFLDEWLALPLFAGLDERAAARHERLANTVPGLQSSLRLAGTGAQAPLWDDLASLAMPVLLVTGALDTKFTAIAEEMAGRIGPNATHEVIAGAGHTAHLEQPDAFLAVLRPWLAAHP